MKLLKNLSLVFLLAIAIGCSEKEKLVEVVEEVPEDIVATKLCETLYSNIMSMFPEFKNNQQKYAALFSDTAQKQIILTKDSEVYVSFVGEGASITNTLGWYHYDQASTPDMKNINKELVFPNISNTVLKTGDTRQLGNGKFKAGTVIGFFLVVGGFSDNTVDYRKPTFYTNFEWNESQSKQHVLFVEKQCGDIVVGYEDKLVVNGSDSDYNDVTFTVSDNVSQLHTTSFNLKSVGRL